MLIKQYKEMSDYLKEIKLLWKREMSNDTHNEDGKFTVWDKISESELRVIKRKLEMLEGNQKKLAQVATESLSILNVIRTGKVSIG